MQTFNWQDETEKQWNQQAIQWSERSRHMWDKGSRKRIIPFIERHLQHKGSILDIGCGDGYGSFKLKQAGYDVTGVDLSADMVDIAKKNHHDIPFLQGSILELPFKDRSFSAVMAINVLEWLENPLHGLQEIDRVLKEDSLFFVGILGPTAGPRKNSYPRLYKQVAICNTMMPWELKQLAEEQGFHFVDGFGVYKRGVKAYHYKELTESLQQALSFMWVYCFRKNK
ncbi:MAG TPA: class I SAM-dependent methyltransferase [Cerasibacillus sp.]|uniref:class I SAM-dependent methyltransferase n=1 Tax=Cerasibacillus sp. TaxID=2498711 RepID=UPI002F3F6373